MKESNDYLPTCKQAAFTEAVVKACSNQSGAVSPFITDPDNCHWSPARLVGVLTPCGMITQTDALVMERIWAGPTATDGKKLWYGVEPGASLSAQADTSTIDGVTTPEPFSIPLGWFQYYLKQDPSWNWQTLTYSQFDQLFAQSVSESPPSSPPTTPTCPASGRTAARSSSGTASPTSRSPPGNRQLLPASPAGDGRPGANGHLRTPVLAPGAAHCESAAGPRPDNPLAAVVDSVEHGKPPTTIVGTVTNPVSNAITLTRPLCPYPASAAYTGHGSPSDASTFTCTTSEHSPGPAAPRPARTRAGCYGLALRAVPAPRTAARAGKTHTTLSSWVKYFRFPPGAGYRLRAPPARPCRRSAPSCGTGPGGRGSDRRLPGHGEEGPWPSSAKV